METEEGKSIQELKHKIFQIFKDFMTGITKLEELGSVGGTLLNGFHQSLEFLRRKPIKRESQLVESIIKANETRRLNLYFEAGCANVHDTVHHMNKLQTCLLELQDHLAKAKSTLKELQLLLEDSGNLVRIATQLVFSPTNNESDDQLDQGVSVNEEKTSSNLKGLQMTDYAGLMAIIYSMVKQDFVMQERIITSLSLKSSSGELESYSLMWSLRPYISDELVHEAWKHI